MSQDKGTPARLVLIVALQADSEGLAVTLEGDVHARLRKEVHDHDSLQRVLEKGLARKHPLLVVLSDKREILEVWRAEQDVVIQLREEPEYIKAHLQVHDGLLKLRRDHQRFAELHQILIESRHHKRSFWYGTDPLRAEVVDLRFEPAPAK